MKNTANACSIYMEMFYSTGSIYGIRDRLYKSFNSWFKNADIKDML